AHHEEVLAETVSSAAPASEEPETAADVEELDGMDFGDADPKRSKLEREVIEMQAEYERWEQRRKLAEQKGDRALGEQATRAADRRRARRHAALAERARLGSAPPPPPPPEDPLAALKRRAAQAGVKTLEDELAALKERLQAEKKRR